LRPPFICDRVDNGVLVIASSLFSLRVVPKDKVRISVQQVQHGGARDRGNGKEGNHDGAGGGLDRLEKIRRAAGPGGGAPVVANGDESKEGVGGDAFDGNDADESSSREKIASDACGNSNGDPAQEDSDGAAVAAALAEFIVASDEAAAAPTDATSPTPMAASASPSRRRVLYASLSELLNAAVVNPVTLRQPQASIRVTAAHNHLLSVDERTIFQE